jgi:hypothetical protein
VPVVLSGSEDDTISPSQHKLAMAEEIADKSVVSNSSSGGEEEEVTFIANNSSRTPSGEI